MGVMTLDEIWPMTDRMLTVDDLMRQPDDGNRYELVDGVLQVSPAPRNDHQRVATRLGFLLEAACPSELEVLMPLGLNLDKHNHRIPDIAVVRSESVVPDQFFEDRPLLVVEVTSNSTRRRDLTTKKHEYAEFGIESYWIVAPDFERPSLTAFELEGGRYRQVALVAGDEEFRAVRPYPAAIVPSLLVRNGAGWKAELSR